MFNEPVPLGDPLKATFTVPSGFTLEVPARVPLSAPEMVTAGGEPGLWLPPKPVRFEGA